MNKLKNLWMNLSASFWFLPAIIVASSAALAVGLVEVDSSKNPAWMEQWPRLFGAGAAGARAMLATIAGSMTTVVGVTFSMTLVALTLASSQYTSRVLRNFMSDRVTQVVLGIFAGTFTYCIIVLRSIRGDDDGGFVPSLSVTVSVVLAIAGIGTLIFFIHHIASSIQASSIAAAVARETLAAVDRLFPERLGADRMADDADSPSVSLPNRNWQPIMAKRNGYLQSVDNDALLRLARKHQTIVRMDHGIGDFVVRGTPLASLALENPPDKEMISTLRSAYSIDRFRTVHQDCAFGIRQLVDMALRALSPGVNDTTTAVMCIDYLTAILSQLASRKFPSTHRVVDGQLRVISIGQAFPSLVAQSFDEIRGSSSANVTIMVRMAGALQTIATQTERRCRRQVLLEQLDSIAELAGRTVESPRDQTRMKSQLAQVRNALQPIFKQPARAATTS